MQKPRCTDGIDSVPMSAAATVDRFPPGPPTRRPGVGSLPYYLRFAADPIGFVKSRFDRYGDIYYAASAGSGGLFVLRRPEHLKEVLVTHASSFTKEHTAFRTLSRFLGAGLLTTDGDTWTRQRRMVAPAFAPARLSEYAAVMSEEAAGATEKWRDGMTVEMGREMMELTLRVVSRTLFGHDVRAETEGVARAMSTFQHKIATPDFLPAWFPSPTRRKVKDAIDTIDSVIFDMIARRRAESAESRKGVRPDLLQRLLTAVDEEGDGSKLTEQEVRDQLVTLFLAGHETTSHALTWTLYLLSQNLGAAGRLYQELDAVLDGRPATFEDLPKLAYTEQVIEEAMRLYPPVYSVARFAREDTEIGGYVVPAGSEVMMWIYFTQRDARWFPDPTAFRPERFAPAEEAKMQRFAYLPFGAGPRACIGKSFAMIEAKIILATLASRFRFEHVRGHRAVAQPRITLVPKHGMKMTLHAR